MRVMRCGKLCWGVGVGQSHAPSPVRRGASSLTPACSRRTAIGRFESMKADINQCNFRRSSN